MQYLKNASWFPLLKEGATTMNRVVSLVVAFLISVGIHLTFTGSANSGWSFAGTIPSVWVLLQGAFRWASQFIFQETGYTALGGLQALQGIVAKLQSVIPPVPGGAVHPIPGAGSVNVTPVETEVGR
jgi:hypothetical protein